MYNSKHSHNCQQLCMTELTHSDIREDIGTKKRFLSGIARITGTPPIRATWSFFFGHQNSRFENHLREGD